MAGLAGGRRRLVTAIDCWLHDVRPQLQLQLLLLMLLPLTTYTTKSVVAGTPALEWLNS